MSVRALDPKDDWPFFHRLHPIAPADRECMQPLEEASAQSLWRELVSAAPRERHPMLLPQGHWLGNTGACGPNWQKSWGERSDPDPVVEFLRSRIDWPDDAEVFFIWMRERTVRVPWGVFLRCWRNFLFSNEGPFLVRLQYPEFVWFSPTALMGVGHRVEPLYGLRSQ